MEGIIRYVILSTSRHAAEGELLAGVKLHIDPQFGRSVSWGVLPLFDSAGGNVCQDRVSADNLNALHVATRSYHHIQTYCSADVGTLQVPGIWWIDFVDQLARERFVSIS